MKKIRVQTSEGTITMQGDRISSALQWSKNVEKRTHIKNGNYATIQVPTDCLEEVWLIDGEEITLMRYSSEDIEKYMIKL